LDAYGVTNQGIQADGSVDSAGGVEEESSITHGRIEVAGSVGEQSFTTNGRVPCEIRRTVKVLKRARTDGRMASAGSVALQGPVTHSRVVVPGRVELERRKTGSRVEVSRIVNEHLVANTGILNIRNKYPNSRRARWTRCS